METVALIESKHPDENAETVFESLIGVDKQKEELTTTLTFLFDKERITKWQKVHHGEGLPFVKRIVSETPLVIFSGEVGCGKTALANSVGTPVAKRLDKRLPCFEPPSDVRGRGMV